MKAIPVLFAMLLTITVSSQDIPFEKLDSLSVVISDLEKKTEGKEYKDVENQIYTISFPDENFKVWTYNRLATKAVYQKNNTGEILLLTENIDFSKATGISVAEDYKGVASIKVDFPEGHLQTQIIKDGEILNTQPVNHLEFFCPYGTVDQDKKFLFDKMYDLLYGLSTQLKIEKKLMTEIDVKKELADWAKLNSVDFINKYPNSLHTAQARLNAEQKSKENKELQKNQNYINQLADKYKFKRGLTTNEFSSLNPEAAFLFRKKGFDDGNTTTYNNIRGMGKPYPEGPLVAQVSSSYVTLLQHVTHCGKEASTPADIDAFNAEIIANIDSKYVKKTENGYKIDVPKANAKIELYRIDYNKWTANYISFE